MPKEFALVQDVPKEDDEQMVLVKWLKYKGILHYHVPNGGRRSLLEGLKLKRMGVCPGVPDICIPVAKNGYHGLYVEMKRRHGGHLTDQQTWWLKELIKNGYHAIVAHGFDAAQREIINYLKD